jgi:hypothetical protein
MRRSNSNNKYLKRRPLPSMIGDDDGIASRTRSRKKTASLVATKWDIPTTIIIQLISWLDQDDLTNLSLVIK